MPHNPNITWVPHIRLAWGGVLGAPPLEIWSNTLRFKPASTVTPTPQQLAAVANSVGPDLQAWFTSGLSMIGAAAHLSYLKVTWVQASGLQRDADTIQRDYPAGPAGAGAGVVTAQWYQSYCLTLRTGIRRGRGHAGRIFPPQSGPAPAGTTPYCGDADANNMSGSFRNFMDTARTHIIASISPGSEVGGFAVFSPGDTARGRAPIAQPITGVVCDRVADVIHGRTNRVPRLEAAMSPTNQ